MRTGGVRFTRGHDPFAAARQHASAAQGEQGTPLPLLVLEVMAGADMEEVVVLQPLMVPKVGRGC